MNPGEGAAITLEAWMARLRAEIGEAGATLPGPERDALLELTRLAAHASERIAGPLTVYALGMALAGVPQEARLERIREITARLAAGT
jgi:Domain of unknown function (DUF6457)